MDNNYSEEVQLFNVPQFNENKLFLPNVAKLSAIIASMVIIFILEEE